MADCAYFPPVKAYYSPPPPPPMYMCTCMSSVKWSSVAQ